MGFLIYLAQEDGDFFQSMKQQLTLAHLSQNHNILRFMVTIGPVFVGTQIKTE